MRQIHGKYDARGRLSLQAKSHILPVSANALCHVVIDIGQPYVLTPVNVFDQRQKDAAQLLFAHTKYGSALKKALSLHQKKKKNRITDVKKHLTSRIK